MFYFGGGARWKLRKTSAFDMGYRVLHVSTASTTSFNPGLDNNVFYAGYLLRRQVACASNFCLRVAGAHPGDEGVAGIVESRPWRTSAQSLNFWDCLISVSVVGGSKRSANSRSTTADLGFFGSGRSLLSGYKLNRLSCS